MKESESSDLLRLLHLPPKNRPKFALTHLIPALALSLGMVCGWAMHNHLWRKTEMDYTLDRAVAYIARCSGVPADQHIRAMESRVGRARSLFRIDDKLTAIDYVFDRLESRLCTAPGTP